MEAVVELQGFKDNYNRFIVKELAVVSDGLRCQVIFKPPYDLRQLNDKMYRTAQWLTRHYHRIKWEEGNVEYDENLIRNLCNPFNVVYTKGTEKAKFLREFHPNVKEITMSKTKSCKVNCLLLQHRDTCDNCALRAACSHYKSIKGDTE